MKVALVNPMHTRSMFTKEQLKLCESTVVQISEEQAYPLEFGYISALLKEKGHVVKIIDAHSFKLPQEKLIEELKGFNPDVVGIPNDVYSASRCPTPFYPHVIATIKLLREAGLNSKFVIWGAHSTIFPHKVIEDTGAEVVIRGEPEFTFINTVLNLDNLGDVRGISFFDGRNIIDNPDAEPVDLNALPIPDYDNLNIKEYRYPLFPKRRYFMVMASRGCPYSCVYCAKDIIGKYRERKIELVVEELEALKEREVSHFTFTDEIFTLKKERTMKICQEMIDRKLNMQWMCQTRPEKLDEDMFKIMKEAGCTWIGIGFESASKEILKNIGKKPDLESTKKCIDLGKKYGITVNLFTMSFLPGETRATLNETLQFIKKNQPDIISTTITTAIPGTELWKRALSTGELETGNWEECLQKVGQISIKEFTPQEVEDYRRLFPTVITLSNRKLIVYKLKAFIRNPEARINYVKKLTELARYKVRNIKK